MNINVHADTRKIRRELQDSAREIPFATALALTTVAKTAAADITSQLPSIFDRPTPFTMRAITWTKADKKGLTASVDVRPVQASYLAVQETGGTETPTGTAFVIPKQAPRNSYGNLPKGYLARMKGRKTNQAFVGEEKGTAGFWLRQGRGKLRKLVLLAAFVHSRTYKPRFGYHERVAKSVKANLPAAMSAAISRALATSKP